MSRTPARRPARALIVAGALAATTLLGACTPRVTPTVPAPPSASTNPSAGNPAGQCADPTRTYDALAPFAPGQPPKGGILEALHGRGRLIVGIAADQAGLSSRDRASGEFAGFDVDVYKDLSKALFGADDKVEVRLINPNDALSMLADQSVDVVVQSYAATCGRWDKAALSAPYLQTKQRLAVRRGSGDTLEKAAGKKVCAIAGTPVSQTVAQQKPTMVYASTATGCLAKFQAGEVDMITADAPVLAGLTQQDPYLEVLPRDLDDVSYVVAVRKERKELAQFVNTVLAARAADGRWQASYDKWLKPSLGDAKPPAPKYGRA